MIAPPAPSAVPAGRPITPPAASGDPAQLARAARDFEAMALAALLTPMFESVDLSRGPFGGGAGEAAWKPMMIEHIAKKIADRGGLGLAGPVHRALLRLQEEKRS